MNMQEKIEVNPVTGLQELHMPAKLVRISGDKRTLATEKATGYRLCDVEVTYDDGTKDTVNASVWEKSIEKNLFAEGQDIALVIQVEGEYEGFAKVQLQPAKQVDTAKLSDRIAKAKAAFTAKVAAASTPPA